MSLPAGWKKAGLDECYWFQEGPGVRKWQFTNAGIKLLNVANIEKSGQLNLAKTERHLSVEEVKERYTHFLIDAGDLVIASSGISFDDDGLLRTRGAFVEPQHLPICLNTSTIRFKAKSEISDLAYLKHWLDSREFRQQITKLVTGSAQQNFGPSHLKSLSISLPPLPEQKRIAAILDQADALRAKRREGLAELDKLEESLFEELQLKTRDSCEHVPLTSLAANVRGSFVNGPFGSDLLTGELQNEGVPVVYIRDIRDGKYLRVSKAFVSEKKADELNVCKVFPDDVLVAKVGDPPGISAVYPSNEPTAIVTQDVIRIRPNLDIALPEFISAYVNSSVGKWRISGITVEATRARFSLWDFKSLVVDLPPLSRQTTFVAEINSLRQLSHSQKDSLKDLNSLFASLQHRAFRGEL